MNAAQPSSGTNLLVTADLMLASHAEGVARRAGTTLVVAGNSDEAIAAHNVHQTGCVFVDLGLSGLDIERLVGELRAADRPPATIAAFGPHVQQARLERARQVGCDRVLSRGRFHREMEVLLAGSGTATADHEPQRGPQRAN